MVLTMIGQLEALSHVKLLAGAFFHHIADLNGCFFRLSTAYHTDPVYCNVA